MAEGDETTPVQDLYAPRSICFGCGPANTLGLQIKSRRHGDGLRTVFRPRLQHQALIDCHGNWTAAVALLDARGAEELPSTVTARFEVKLRRITPIGEDLSVTSRVRQLDVEAGRVEVSVTVTAGGRVTAEGEGLFVAVEAGHPAHHRWQ
ncbi:MAG: PaaI family thioesterase [Anaerolineae bacterium]